MKTLKLLHIRNISFMISKKPVKLLYFCSNRIVTECCRALFITDCLLKMVNRNLSIAICLSQFVYPSLFMTDCL